MNKKIKDLLNKFTYRAEWSAEDRTYIACCIELPSIKAHADSAEGAIKEVKVPISVALETMLKDKETPPEPLGSRSYKGNLTLRAAESGKSINTFFQKLDKDGAIVCASALRLLQTPFPTFCSQQKFLRKIKDRILF